MKSAFSPQRRRGADSHGSRPVPSDPQNAMPNETMDYHKYATDPGQFQTWVDVIFSRFKLPIFVTAALLGIAVYFVGLFIAATINFGREYIGTRAIYFGVFGISLVSAMVRYASLTIHQVFEDFRPCYPVSDEVYSTMVKRWFTRLSRTSGNLSVVFVFILMAMLLVFSEFSIGYQTQVVAVGSFKIFTFEPFWYFPENLGVKTLIIMLFGVAVAFPLGTAFRLLSLNFLFLMDVKKFPVISNPDILRVRIRELLDFYVLAYMTWSVGIALFGVVFFNGLDLTSFLLLSILNVLGLLTFVGPQIIYRDYILRSYRYFTGQTLRSYYSQAGVILNERQNEVLQSVASPELLAMRNVNGTTSAIPEKLNLCIYTFWDFLGLAASQAIVYGSVFLGRIF
jgi:hypothetical protein